MLILGRVIMGLGECTVVCFFQVCLEYYSKLAACC